MSRHALLVTCSILCLPASSMLQISAAAEESPEQQTVRVELQSEPLLILLGKDQTERGNIDSVTSDVPPQIAAAVKAWTGIDVPKQTMTVKFFHRPHQSDFAALSSASETGSYKGYIKFGNKVLQDEERHVRYKQVLNASNEKSFFVVGVIEFDNPKTQRRCQVRCQFSGHKPAASEADPYIHPAGTATWTGPIVSASRAPFSDDDAPGAKQH